MPTQSGTPEAEQGHAKLRSVEPCFVQIGSLQLRALCGRVNACLLLLPIFRMMHIHYRHGQHSFSGTGTVAPRGATGIQCTQS